MNRLVLPAAFLALFLAGCGDTGGGGGGGEGAEGPAQRKVTLKNKDHEALMALPDDLQRIGLMRQIRNTGNRCPRRVESGRYQGKYEELDLWTARCDDNRQWAIFLSASGHVQVRNCEQMERLGLPRCAELPPAPPQPPVKSRRPAVTTER